MNRRDFLSSSTGAFALAGQTDVFARKPVVATHLWVYASNKPGYDCSPMLDEVFADVAYAGFDAVELMDINMRHADVVAKVGDLIARHKVAVIGASYSQPLWDKTKQGMIEEDAGKVIERIAALKGKLLGISVGDAGRTKTDEELDVQAGALKKIQAMGKAHGVVPNLHNHTYEVANGLYDLENTLKRVPDMALGPDLAWLFQAKVDVPTFLEKYSSRMVYQHLRDHLWTGLWSEALGDGITDFKAIARQLKKLNYTGDLAVELAFPSGFKPTRPLRESLKKSRNVIRDAFGV